MSLGSNSEAHWVEKDAFQKLSKVIKNGKKKKYNILVQQKEGRKPVPVKIKKIISKYKSGSSVSKFSPKYRMVKSTICSRIQNKD